ncbi:MAG: hypothetical protein A4E53_01168 [Pelotomaculum sp. PtaB.Bin104]|nr:MAG: hypothetical protein A4E53_01168 [Pelotomaculum sp. PtaB.Bin104]
MTITGLQTGKSVELALSIHSKVTRLFKPETLNKINTLAKIQDRFKNLK